MANDILKTAIREEQALFAELSKNPTFRKWQSVKSVIASYSEQPEVVVQPVANTAERKPVIAKPAPPAEVFISSASKPLSRAPVIVAAAIAYFRETNKRINSTQLAPILIERGLEIPGLNKASTLSAYLSMAKEIDNVRGEGYGLREWSRQSEAMETLKAVTVRDMPPNRGPH